MLFLIAFPAVLGIAYGYARGGRLRNLAGFQVHAWWLLLLASAVQVCRYRHVPGTGWLFGSYTSLRPMLIVFGIVAVWLVLNTVKARPERAGILLIATGWLANFVVMAVNNGMPVDRDAAISVGFRADIFSTNQIGDYHALSSADRLGWLADVMPVPYVQRVASVGDVLIVLGVMAVFAVAMRRREAAAEAPALATAAVLRPGSSAAASSPSASGTSR
jgi:hypothetical protein